MVYGGRSRRSRGIEVLKEGSSEVDDGLGRVDWDAGEERKVLAAMRIRCEV